MTPLQQISDDYRWLYQNLPANIGYEFKARLSDMFNTATAMANGTTSTGRPPGTARGRGETAAPTPDGKVTAQQLLTVLQRNPKGLTLAELAEKTNGRPASIGTILKRGKELQGQVSETGGTWTATGTAGTAGIAQGARKAA